jgi:hypothetical protein
MIKHMKLGFHKLKMATIQRRKILKQNLNSKGATTTYDDPRGLERPLGAPLLGSNTIHDQKAKIRRHNTEIDSRHQLILMLGVTSQQSSKNM